jgi:pilus assembly protein CpaF
LNNPANKPTTVSDQRGQAVDLRKVKAFLTNALLRGVESDRNVLDQGRQVAAQNLAQIYAKTGLQLADNVRDELFTEVLDELLGFGPIQSLLDDPDITEVMVNGHKQIYIEKKGKVSKSDITFENNDHVLRVIDRIITPLGRRVDANHPTVDARLPDGSRVNAVIPPVAVDGPSITIRKFSKERLTVDQLIRLGSMTESIAEFLRACVVSRMNIIISGGTGSGKTTLLNILSSFIPEEDRIVTIEDAAELQLQQEHVVRLEAKPANPDGSGAVTIRDLVRNSLRMRPERIVVGECRGGEALDMLQAMNTGHDGSLTTLHANTPRDAISRLETMSLMAGLELPIKVLREQIASAVDLIVQQTRLRDGTRKITQITELAGMEGDTVVLTDVFKFEQTGIGQDGKVIGEIKPTGIRPMFSTRLEAAGFKLKPEIFGVNVAEMLASGRRGSGRNW